MDSKETLINFLRNVASALEDNTVTEIESEIIKDFYLSYNMRFLDQDENDIKKYLTYGWYLNSLINKKSNNIIK